jgi:hypothetical protein
MTSLFSVEKSLGKKHLGYEEYCKNAWKEGEKAERVRILKLAQQKQRFYVRHGIPTGSLGLRWLIDVLRYGDE